MVCIVCPLLIAWPASAYTFWQSDRLKAAHRDLARAHAQLAAAHRRLADKARRDDMTGMLNRESFFAALEHSRRRSDRGALLIIDADHFKAINDSYGHLTGDEALLLIAAAIKDACAPATFSGASAARSSARSWSAPASRRRASWPERIRGEVEGHRLPSARGRDGAAHGLDRRHRVHDRSHRVGADARGGPPALRGQAWRPQTGDRRPAMPRAA